MHLIGFFIFLVIIGLLIEGAKRNGEVKFSTTKREQANLNRRGTTLLFLLWIPVGVTMCVTLNWMAGGLQDHDKLVVYSFAMVAAGIPAGLLAFVMNTLLEHIGATRIQKSASRR